MIGICVCVFCLHICMCSTYVSGAPRAQRRVSDPPELKLEMAGSCHRDAGTKPKFSERAAAYPLGHLSSPRYPKFQEPIHFTKSSHMPAIHSFVTRAPRGKFKVGLELSLPTLPLAGSSSPQACGLHSCLLLPLPGHFCRRRGE